MDRPAFFRIGYNAGTGELFLAYDIGLTPEKPTAHVVFCRFDFEPQWGFRAALARYYEVFPEAFRCRTPEQGLWMPFAKISQVEGWEDFGFKFKEGNNETAWDDEHDIITFRYTEPMTWWMRMPRRHAAHAGGGPGRGQAPGRGEERSPGESPVRPAAITTRTASCPPGCSTRPGATGPCGA